LKIPGHIPPGTWISQVPVPDGYGLTNQMVSFEVPEYFRTSETGGTVYIPVPRPASKARYSADRVMTAYTMKNSKKNSKKAVDRAEMLTAEASKSKKSSYSPEKVENKVEKIKVDVFMPVNVEKVERLVAEASLKGTGAPEKRKPTIIGRKAERR